MICSSRPSRSTWRKASEPAPSTSSSSSVWRGALRQEGRLMEPTTEPAKPEPEPNDAKPAKKKKVHESAVKLSKIDQTLRQQARGRRPDAQHSRGLDLRAHRAERSRQDDDVLDARRLPRADAAAASRCSASRRAAVDELRGRLGVLPQDALLPPLDRVGELLIHARAPSRRCRTRRPSASPRDVASRGGRPRLVGHALRRALARHGQARRARAGHPRRAGRRPARRAHRGPRPARRLRGAPARQGAQGQVHGHHLEPQPAGARGGLRRRGHPRPRQARRRRARSPSSRPRARRSTYACEAPASSKGRRFPLDAIRAIPGVTRYEYDEEQSRPRRLLRSQDRRTPRPSSAKCSGSSSTRRCASAASPRAAASSSA